MGKFRSKLKGQTKGKRWPKGQSSSSNPETRKYRDLAKSRFFQENLGPSNLTSDALRKHDAVSSYVPPKLPTAEPSAMDEDSEVSTFKTIQTFASDWSECSNVSFSRLMHVFKPDSAMHKEMLAVLAAVTDVIKQNGGSESSTEYYAALMTTLEVTETEMSLTAVLSLLQMGIRSVPNNVLRVQFAPASKIFLDLLDKNSNSENAHILKSLLGLLAALLRAQEPAMWSSVATLQMFGSILAFTCHTKPKIRKAAQSAVCGVLHASCFMIDELEPPPSHHPAAAHVANFIVQQLEASTGASGSTTTLHTLQLLKDIIQTFPRQQLKRACECLLQLLTLQHPVVGACALQALHALFSAPRGSALAAQLNGQLLTALYDFQPAPGDVGAMGAWLTTMTAGHVHLADLDPSAAMSALPRAFDTVTQLWLSPRPELLSGATHALHTLLEDCVGPHAELPAAGPALERVYSTLHACLSGYQFHRSWHLVLHVVGTAARCCPRDRAPALLSPMLHHLADLRDSYKFSYNNELEFAVGAAVKAQGPEFVLNIISLQDGHGGVNIDRSWLLPVLKENIQCSTLQYFAQHIVSLATLCERHSKQLTNGNDGIGAHSYELLYIQLWSLLPSFCRHPTDIAQNFKNVAKLLGSAIADRKELRLFVMSSLRKLIQNSKEDMEEQKELGRFAKNYLPILFNLYTTIPHGTDEEGQRLAALDTVREYLTIAPAPLTHQLFANALESFKTKTDSFSRQSILDLIRCLSLYQSSQSLDQLFNEFIKTLLEIKNKKEQKKAYRLLEEICCCESEECKAFVKKNRKQIQNLLLKSLSSAAVSSRAARLRCQTLLVQGAPQLSPDARLVRGAVPEAVLCCRDINQRCRAAARALLLAVGERLQMGPYTTLLLAGLAGPPDMVQATVLALATITHHFTGILGQDNIKHLLETVAQLMTSSSREIVASCLVYIKIYITSIASPIVAQNLPEIVKSIISMTEDCQKHFRIRVRNILDKLIRKFGCESITALVPANEVIILKRIRNLRKLNERKKRQRQEEQNSDEEDEEFIVRAKPRSMDDILADSDSDFEERRPEVNPKKKQLPKSWIQEDEDDIVDFTDPKAASRITATKPGSNLPQITEPKPKDRGFKTSSDGRLIIKDDSDASDSENADSDHSEDDYKSAAETAILGVSSKRKRAETDSVRSAPVNKYRAGGSGIHRPLNGAPGTEFRSKKASGDVKRQGHVDPYAYLPLSRQLLNKRQRSKTSGQFKNIVRAAKTGARKGTRQAGKITKRK